jgi:two-component system nitrate/nitrite response regulator NarL
MQVFLADSQTKRRTALKQLLDQDPEMNVVGEVSEANGLLQRLEETRSDLLLLFWKLPGMQAAELLPILRATGSPSKVVVFDECIDDRDQALAVGADAFVSQEDPVEWLLRTLHSLSGLSPCSSG